MLFPVKHSSYQVSPLCEGQTDEEPFPKAFNKNHAENTRRASNASVLLSQQFFLLLDLCAQKCCPKCEGKGVFFYRNGQLVPEGEFSANQRRSR